MAVLNPQQKAAAWMQIGEAVARMVEESGVNEKAKRKPRVVKAKKKAKTEKAKPSKTKKAKPAPKRRDEEEEIDEEEDETDDE